MTFPITPFPSIHTDPTAAQEAALALQATYQGLQLILAQLPGQIANIVIGAILKALGLSQFIPVVQNAESYLSSITQNFQQGLQVALAGILPAAQDFFDGTASPLGNQIVQNLDGTASLVLQSGSTLVNTLIDSADGTAMSAGTALHNMIQGFGTHAYSLNNWNTVIGQTGVQQASQLVSSLSGIIPAALDNLDGTAATLGSQVVQNLDGTATYVAQAVQSGVNSALAASTGVNALIDNLDGTAMSFFHSVSQGFNNTLGGLLHAFTGSPVTGTTTTQAQQAQVTAAAAALQQRLAILGNGAEEQVDIELSAYSNGAIPGVFTGFGSNVGTAPTVSGGLLTVTGNALVQNYEYNGSTTLTDYQQITGVWPTLTQGSGGSVPSLLGRLNAGGTVSITARYTTLSAGWNLVAAGGSMSVIFSDTFTPGAAYSLMCGDPTTVNLYKFQILKNGTPLPLASVTVGDTSQLAGQLFYVDTGQTTGVGGANRSCGLGMNIGSGTNGTISMSSFKFQDTLQSTPSVLVTTSEATTSTIYTDLATISDEVVVNIGTSGLALVTLSANVMNGTSTGDSFMSFAVSGANTLAASDTNSIMYQAWTAGAQGTFGAPILLTGLAPGLTVFKAKYRSSGSTATFANRRIGVVAL